MTLKYRLLMAGMALLPWLGLADCGHPEHHQNPEIRGRWWCDDPPAPKAKPDPTVEKTPVQTPQPPPRYPHAQMMAMHPDQLEPLLKAHRRWAVYTARPSDVHEYYRVQDVARRKALAFAATSETVMMQYPELSSRSSLGLTTPGNIADLKQQHDFIQRKLQRVRDRYALGLFVRGSCPVCQVAEANVQDVQDDIGWRVKRLDLDQQPALARRFNVTTTPLLLLIKKDHPNGQGFPVSVGVESQESIIKRLYAVVRLMEGEIKPEQFFTHELQKGRFLDPLAEEPKQPTGFLEPSP